MRMLNKYNLEHSPKSLDTSFSPSSVNQTFMSIRFPASNSSIHGSFDHLITVGRQGQSLGELWLPTCVAVDPTNNLIYVTDGVNSSARISIFSDNGEPLNSYTHNSLTSPWGIAVNDDNIYLTDTRKQCVFHFKLTKDINLIAIIGGKGSGSGQFNVPKQLVIFNNQEIYVADLNNNRIQVLDLDLRYQRHISHRSMTQPSDIKLTTNELYVLSVEDSPCLHVFSHAGDKIRSLITNGEGMQVNLPCFCLPLNGDFIITDNKSDQVKLFSNEGVLLSTLGETGDKVGMFHSPYGVALTNNLKLIVISWNVNYGLQIFS